MSIHFNTDCYSVDFLHCKQPFDFFIHKLVSTSTNYAIWNYELLNTTRAGPRTLDYGGGIECGRHDVSGIRCKGGEYERGCAHGGPGKKWEIVVPEKRF